MLCIVAKALKRTVVNCLGCGKIYDCRASSHSSDITRFLVKYDSINTPLRQASAIDDIYALKYVQKVAAHARFVGMEYALQLTGRCRKWMLFSNLLQAVIGRPMKKL